MTTVLAATALLCGIPVGFIIGILAARHVYLGTKNTDEFDGGYGAQNPPVRTIIWSKNVDQR